MLKRIAIVGTALAAVAAMAGFAAGRTGHPNPRPQPAAPKPLTRVLRVCADPNNLPFSDAKGEGFENRIAELLAKDLGDTVEYTWWAQRRGFVRNTLKAGKCDVVIGTAAGDDMMLTSKPYYRSTYVFVTKPGTRPVTTFDDPRLRTMRVGVHVIGDDYTALPPGVALAQRGIIRNVHGYSIYGDYKDVAPPARLIDAVAKGDVDVAAAWGPLAGYFASREPMHLTVTPVADRQAIHGIPFTFGIALGVRHGDKARLDTLQHLLDKHRRDVRAILESYGVPLVEGK